MASINQHLQTMRTLFLKASPGISLCYFMHLVLRDNSWLSNRFHKLEYHLIKNKLKKKFKDTINEFKHSDECEKIGTIKKLWIIWWQGIDDTTPKQILINLGQLKKIYPDVEIIVINKSNYRQYVDVSTAVYRNFENKKMNISQFSDYLRVLLLQKYGGLYLDANFFLTHKIEYKDSAPFFTINHGLYSDYHVCKGKWTTGCLLSAPGNGLFNYLKCMFEEYAEAYDFYLGYFLFDAFIAVAYENNASVRQMIDSVPTNNSYYNFINEQGNDTCKRHMWNRIKEENYIFNASYRKDFIYEIDGKTTYYGELMKVLE